MDEVGEYEVYGLVAGGGGDLFHKCGHIVVILSGHADEVFRCGHESDVAGRMPEVVVANVEVGESDARFIREHGFDVVKRSGR